MKIAVLGIGIAGLAAAWHLQSQAEVTLFGSRDDGASIISTGLLHPFPGKMALPSWRAKEGMEETLKLIEIAENHLGRSVANRAGIFRFAMQAVQREKFRLRPEWQESAPIAGAANLPGLWIAEGVVVYSKLYLEGLFQACLSRGVLFEEGKVESLASLGCFDRVVLAMGAQTLEFLDLPLERVKGQALLCRCQEPIPFGLIGNGHIAPTEDPHLCRVGATYEHDFTDLLPHKEATSGLLASAASFYPPAEAFQVLDVTAGVRLGKKGASKPTVAQIDPRTWVFTGLGSRGLLYHALLGKELAVSVLGSVF